MTAVSSSLDLGLIWASHGRQTADAGETDETLVRSFVATGSNGDFERIVARYSERVFRLAMSVLGPQFAAEAEDVTQDVFVVVYRKVGTFRGRSRFSTWLYRVAYNAAAERRRQARLHGPPLGEEPMASVAATEEQANPVAAAEAGEQQRILRRCVDELDEPYRTVVHLHYWMRCTVSEIASRLDVRPGTVKSYLHRARARLARSLEEQERHE